MGFLELLTLLLLVAKLTNLTTISWWWVFAPLTISISLYIILFFIFGWSILAIIHTFFHILIAGG